MSAAYHVIQTKSVVESLCQVSDLVEGRYFHAVAIIGASPEIGREYVPEDGDDEPPVPCRCYHMPDTTKSIYYLVDHPNRTVKIFALIDQRRNPAYRFREARQADGGGTV